LDRQDHLVKFVEKKVFVVLLVSQVIKVRMDRLDLVVRLDPLVMLVIKVFVVLLESPECRENRDIRER
jgi:hypothetical protein